MDNRMDPPRGHLRLTFVKFGRLTAGRFGAGSLTRNGTAALAQSVVVAVCLFLSYRLVILHASLEQFGLWSLMLAGSSVARVTDVSGGGVLARFVAKASNESDPIPSRDIIHTVIITSVAINAVLAIVIWISAELTIPLFVAPLLRNEAYGLLPFVVTSMALGALAIAITSGIDGVQRADQRALVLVVGSLSFLSVCVWLIPSFGIMGFAVAQVVQQVVIIVAGWAVLRRHVSELGWVPYRWRKKTFAETTGYAIKMNAIGILDMLAEPIAKFAFNHAGGPALVAIYELAARLVTQVRLAMVAAATPLIPAFASSSNPGDPIFRNRLQRSTRLAALAAVFTAIIAVFGAPIMSWLLFGRINLELLTMNAALTAGWSFSLVMLPMYLAGIGLGILRWHFVRSLTMIGFIIAGIVVLEPFFGPIGLISAIMIGLFTGSMIILIGNAYTLGVASVIAKVRTDIFLSTIIIIILSSASYALAPHMQSFFQGLPL